MLACPLALFCISDLRDLWAKRNGRRMPRIILRARFHIRCTYWLCSSAQPDGLRLSSFSYVIAICKLGIKILIAPTNSKPVANDLPSLDCEVSGCICAINIYSPLRARSSCKAYPRISAAAAPTSTLEHIGYANLIEDDVNSVQLSLCLGRNLCGSRCLEHW